MTVVGRWRDDPIMLRRLARSIATVAGIAACLLGTALAEKGAAGRPNIILIMADDMGFSDLGCYGSEIATPHIDRLAAGGLRFSQFYNNAKCSPSRASLLTGLYPQQTRDGARKDNHRNLAQVLKSAGYHTLMVGRTGANLGSPVKAGFERYFGLMDGCCNYFNPGLKRAGEPEPGRKRPGEARPWAIDEKVIRPFTPDDRDFYATDAFTEAANGFLDDYGESERPFFLYLPYTAPHFPIHARPGDIAKYRSRYKALGWDKLREQRFAKLKEQGLVSAKWKLSPRDGTIPAWEDLDGAEQDAWDLHMAVYAAMIDRMDQGIGRITAKLRKLGIEKNTVIFFLSDNGACAEEDRAFATTAPGVPPGPVQSYRTQGLAWANASNTPFRKFKWWLHEGGTASPLIAYWPNGLAQKHRGTISHEVAHIMDLMPTCLDIAGVEYPTAGQKHLLPPEGRSLMPVLNGKSRAGHEALFWQFGECRAVRLGKWKLVAGHPNPRLGIDFFKQNAGAAADGSIPWELYDLEADRTETNDLADRYPDRVETMAKQFQAWSMRVSNQRPPLTRETDVEPKFFVADGMNADGSLVKFYKRGLDYANKYFGNYGPYHIYLLGPDNEESVRAIYRKRAKNRADLNAEKPIADQVTEFLTQPNILEEIDAVLAGESTGGLTWSDPQHRIYEDVTTNATGREKDPVENTWGALHEYHHVFQVSQVDSYAKRTSERNLNSWMAEGGATYSSAKFMENLGLIDSFADYMLQLRTTGGNIARPGINDFLADGKKFRLDDESHWENEDGGSAQVYYMLGAWATAYLIHVQGIEEKTVLKDWYFDILPLGKSAAFKKHIGISLEEFYAKFDAFIRQSDERVMAIFKRTPR